MSFDFSEYLLRLKNNQQAIFSLATHLKNCCSGKPEFSTQDYASLKPEFSKLQQIVIAHLEWKKIKFWDILTEIYFQDPEAQKRIEFLRISTNNIKINLLEFFDNHPCDMGDVNPKNINLEYFPFAKILLDYLEDEKKYLVPLLENAKIDL